MRVVRFLLAFAVMSTVGCSDVPPLFPVRGTVIVGDSKPSSGGVLFVSETPVKGLIVSGEVAKDGTFELKTMRTGGDLDIRPGAPAGSYRVTYQKLTDGQDQNFGVVLDGVVIKEGENDLKLEFPAFEPAKAPESKK